MNAAGRVRVSQIRVTHGYPLLTFTTLVRDVLSEVSFTCLIYDPSSIIRLRMTSDGHVLAPGALVTIKDYYGVLSAAGTRYAQPIHPSSVPGPSEAYL